MTSWEREEQQLTQSDLCLQRQLHNRCKLNLLTWDQCVCVCVFRITNALSDQRGGAESET